MSYKFLGFGLILLGLTLNLGATPEVRLKDIVYLGGLRDNQLTGLGIVTGLAGRGDSQNSQLLKEAIANLVSHFGFDLNPKDVRSRNCAVVVVTAIVPPFMRPGDNLDVTVTSIGDARSLECGYLLQTPLKAANGQVYAVAQGQLLVLAERTAPKTTATIAKGALAEREVISTYLREGRLTLILRQPDFVTANNIKQAILVAFPDVKIEVKDSSCLELVLPENNLSDPAAFIARLQNIKVKPDPAAKVVIDAKSGLIIMGEQVRIGRVAVSYKSTSVAVGSYYGSNLQESQHFVLEETVAVADFVKAMREIGMPTDVLIELLKAIEAAGALYGILIIK